MSDRAQSLSYVTYHVLKNVIKEAQTFNCLGKGGASNIRKKMVKRKINLMDLNVVLSPSIFQKRDETFKLISYQRSVRLSLEYYTGRYTRMKKVK